MEYKPLTDSEFVRTVTLIAANHGCEITEIDVDERIIEITGPNEIECSVAIGEFLETNYGISEVDPVEPEIKMVNDNLGWAI